MTRYLLARTLATDPFLEIYENYGPSLPPTEIPFEPPVAGVVQKAKFSRDLKLMATVCLYQRSLVPGIGNPLTPDPGGIVVFSPEDNYVLLGGTPSAKPQLYRRRGPYYVPVDPANYPAFSTGQYIVSAALSSNAQVISFTTADATTTVKLWDKSPSSDVWTNKAPVTMSNSAGEVKITPDSKYLFKTSSSGANQIYRLIGNVYTLVTIPGGVTQIDDWVYRPNGELWMTWGGRVYKLVDSTWTLIWNGPTILSDNGAVLTPFRFAQGGDLIYTCVNRTSNGSVVANRRQYFFTYQWTGSTYAEFIPAAGNPVPTTGKWATNSWAMASRDGKRIAVYSFFIGSAPTQHSLRIYDISGAAGAFTIVQSNEQINTGSTMVPLNFSPDGTRVNCQGNQHYAAVAPYGVLTSIPENPGGTASGAGAVYYSPSGQYSFAVTSSGLFPVIHDGAGQYLNVKTLEGTFLTVWDRDGSGFHERNFVQHIIGTVISDILFSPDGKILSYHTERPANADQSGLGRFIYDLSQQDFISFRGAIRNAGDLDSLAAINDSSTYMVVVFRNDSSGSNVKLYKFATGYVYTLKDTKLVDFGPPAYSKCETVVVAHGGAEPYTLYSHVVNETEDKLVQLPVHVENWDAESDIFAVNFSVNCSSLIIVKEDEIVLIDPESGEEQDSTGTNGPVDSNDDVTIEPDPDDDTPDDDDDDETNIIINNPGVGSGGPNPGQPSGGGATQGPGKTVNNFNYLPYVAINITFRTW